jgi:hypothetical protein
MSEELRRSLKHHAVQLSQRVLNQMYENPFWMERYGERGRRFADEDSLHHISYLDQALAANDAAVFEKYAQWLRAVLVSRGMCSEHLAENYRLLSAAIAEASLPDAGAAQRVLERGVAALRYTEGEVAHLEERRGELLAAVSNANGAAAMREDDQRYLVSYFLDALATGDAGFYESFAARFAPDVSATLRSLTARH